MIFIVNGSKLCLVIELTIMSYLCQVQWPYELALYNLSCPNMKGYQEGDITVNNAGGESSYSSTKHYLTSTKTPLLTNIMFLLRQFNEKMLVCTLRRPLGLFMGLKFWL